MDHKLTQSEIKAAQKNQRDLHQLLTNRIGNATTWFIDVAIWHHNHSNSFNEEINYTISVFTRDGLLEGPECFRASYVKPDDYDETVESLNAFLDKYYPKR